MDVRKLRIANLFLTTAFYSFSFGQTPQSHSTSDPINNVSSGLHGSGMMFTPNKGQIVDTKQQLRPDVLFKGEGGGADIYIRKTGLSYVLSNAGQLEQEVNGQIERLKRTDKNINAENAKQELLKNKTVKIVRIDAELVGCMPSAETLSTGQQEGYTNYFYKHCPQGITNIYSYNEVLQKNIYKNIDLKYYASTSLNTSSGKKQGLKYDIVVNPGGDPSNIQLQYSGMGSLYVSYDHLYIKTELGELEERLPKVYQTINGKVVDVKAKYNIHTKDNNSDGSLVTFEIADYDHAFPLIIDPLTWITYYGGSSQDEGHSVATDGGGNGIFSGSTTSADFPVSPGVYQPHFQLRYLAEHLCSRDMAAIRMHSSLSFQLMELL